MLFTFFFACLRSSEKITASPKPPHSGPSGFAEENSLTVIFLPQKMLWVGDAVAARSRDASRQSRAMTHIVSAGGELYLTYAISIVSANP